MRQAATEALRVRLSWLEGATQPMGPRRIWNVRLSFRTSTRIAVALGALASSAPATALDPAKQLSQFGYRAWTQQQGLPQDSVRVIAQARDGALWLGTDEGLARFDGTDFTVFRQSSDGLSGSFITALVAARDGSVWVGTLGGVSRLKDGRFTNYTHANGLGTPTVSDLFESQDGTIWAVGGRIVSAFRGGAIVNYGPEQGVPAEGLRKLVQTSDGVLFGVGFAEVVRFDGRAVPTLRQSWRVDGRVRHVDHARQRRRAVGRHDPGTRGRECRRTSAEVRGRRRDTRGTGSRGAGRPRRHAVDRHAERPGQARGQPLRSRQRPRTQAGRVGVGPLRGSRRRPLGRNQQRAAQVSRAAVHDVRHARGIPQRPADGSLRGQARHAVDWLSGCRSACRPGLDATASRACPGAAEHCRVLHSGQP